MPQADVRGASPRLQGVRRRRAVHRLRGHPLCCGQGDRGGGWALTVLPCGAHARSWGAQVAVRRGQHVRVPAPAQPATTPRLPRPPHRPYSSFPTPLLLAVPQAPLLRRRPPVPHLRRHPGGLPCLPEPGQLDSRQVRSQPSACGGALVSRACKMAAAAHAVHRRYRRSATSLSQARAEAHRFKGGRHVQTLSVARQ